MTVPRSLLVDSTVSGIYHCISRCVRRAFLCGDHFDHRRDWIRLRLQELAGIFAVDVCGYAVMSNHFHVVLRTDPARAREWSAEEVARRWLCLFPPRGETADPEGRASGDAIERLASDGARIHILRERLGDLSWFMRCLKEPVARRANREDGCTGRFWEGRFRCHRLLDDSAVLACLVYVDLNVIRAGLAPTPEQSDHTSVQDRLRVRRYVMRRRRRGQGRAGVSRPPKRLMAGLRPGRVPRHAEDGIWLAPIERTSGPKRDRRGLLPLPLDAYLQLVDATGRLIRGDKRCAIPSSVRPILERLHLADSVWARCMQGVERFFGNAIGTAASLAEEAVRRRRRWVVGALRI